ncbi:hypothetical protein OIO90_005512 [Microbotryomycetes sp. JL221]|nr:hypothetical protein OIO90_005512 [Microbotryomycetes sp. JL221]
MAVMGGSATQPNKRLTWIFVLSATLGFVLLVWSHTPTHRVTMTTTTTQSDYDTDVNKSPLDSASAALASLTAPLLRSKAWAAFHRNNDTEDSTTTNTILSTYLYDPTNTLTYRQHLERTTSPQTQLIHSSTLTFDKIYVLSLPWRTDRRQQMTKLAKALGLEVEFVDASSKEENFIKWIAERAVEVRRQRVEIMAEAKGVSANKIGGLTIGNDWLKPRPSNDTEFPEFPATKVTPDKDVSWVDVLEDAHSQNKLDLLVPEDDQLNITTALWDQVERIDGRQVNEGVISTFWGHTRAMKKVLENDDDSALILEDDVDVEWDLERLWSRIELKLPKDKRGDPNWDVTFLGHCWGRELLKPAYLHPSLHQSTAPLCLHGYAVTNQGAERILSLLNNPWSAYQTAVDTALPSFIQFGLVDSFSVEPPLIIQRKDGPSDIQSGIGSKWRGLLMDSTVDRIKMSDGQIVDEEVFDPDNLDPATVYRYGKKQQNNDLQALLNQLRESQDKIDANNHESVARTSSHDDNNQSTITNVPSQAQLDSLLKSMQHKQQSTLTTNSSSSSSSKRFTKDLTSLSYAESLPILQSLCLNDSFIMSIKTMMNEQNALETKLNNERIEFSKQLSIKGLSAPGISSKLRLWDKKALSEWQRLQARQQTKLQQLGVPTFSVTKDPAALKKQARVMNVLAGFLDRDDDDQH